MEKFKKKTRVLALKGGICVFGKFRQEIKARHRHRKDSRYGHEKIASLLTGKKICQLIVQKSQCFYQMLKIAKILATVFPYVRVDLYESKVKVYFRELTFTPANGMCPFEPQKWDFLMGDMLDLSKADKKYII